MLYKAIVVALMTIAAGGPAVTLHDSNTTFKRALDACQDSLGSASFALGHARIAAAPGVGIDETEASGGMLNAALRDESGAKSAHVSIDQKSRAVSAKNLRVEMNGRVACILPD